MDDETDEDIMAVLLDTKLPDGMHVCTTETLPNLESEHMEEAVGGESVCVTALKRAALTEQHSVNQSFAAIFTGLLQVCLPLCVCVCECVCVCVAFTIITQFHFKVGLFGGFSYTFGFQRRFVLLVWHAGCTASGVAPTVIL